MAGILAAATVLLFFTVLPTSQWDPSYLFFLLLTYGFIGLMCAVSLRSASSFDPSDLAVFVALVFLGPLPAVVVLVIPDLVLWCTARFRAKALLFNSVGLSFAAACSSLVLLAFGIQPSIEQTLSVQDIPALLLAATVLVALGELPRALLELSDLSTAAATVSEVRATWYWYEGPVAIASAALALAYAHYGPVALAIFPPAVLLWHWSFRRYFGRDGRFSQADLCAQTALGIAETLELGRRQKRLITHAARYLNGDAQIDNPADLKEILNLDLYSREHFDGGGDSVGIVNAELIPLESRVLAVANAWTDLAYEKGESGHALALRDLKSRAGTQFDPLVVAAAEIALLRGGVFIGPVSRMKEAWPSPSHAH